MGSSNYGIPETPLLRGGSSLFSLTFDEFQNVLGEPGARLESMNMEELLKHIWTAEESQAMAAAMNSYEGLNGGLASQFSLQKQTSMSLPRTLSGRMVEDVWKSLQPQQHVGAVAVPSSMNHQRKTTLGDVTLEEFFMKAGLVKERSPLNQAPTNQVFSSHVIPPLDPVVWPPNMQNLPHSSQGHQVSKDGTSTHMHEAPLVQSLGPSNQVPPLIQHHVPSNQAFVGFGGNPVFSAAKDDRYEQNGKPQAGATMSNKTTNAFSSRPPSDKTDWMNHRNGPFLAHQNQQGQNLMQQQASVETMVNKVPNCNNGPLIDVSAGRLPPIVGGLGGVIEPGGLGMGFGANPAPARISFGAGSPLSSEFDEGSPGTSNLPFALITEYGNGQQQRRKRCAEAPVEKVIERRQRRMIKNRESAARSRARKQAYTVELEAEVNQLKEENMKLLQKQEEEAARRKKQILAFMPVRGIGAGYKGCSLKRTHTGPW